MMAERVNACIDARVVTHLGPGASIAYPRCFCACGSAICARTAATSSAFVFA
jgi:hypothetical protein